MVDHVASGYPSAGPSAARRRRPGIDEGLASVAGVVGRSTPRGDKPGAVTVLENDDVKVVAFEFPAGGALREHAAHPAVLVQVWRGAVEFGLPDRTETLTPGRSCT